MGEIPVAKVVLWEDIESDELKEFCRERLTDYKVPYKIVIVKQLPKTHTGKLKRN